MKRIVLLASICILIMAPVVVAQGQWASAPQASCGGGCNIGGGHGGYNGGGGHGECNILRCKDELKLTDDQVKKIKNISHKHRMAMIDLKADLQKAKLNKKIEAHSDNPSRANILSLAKKMMQAKGSIEEAKINNRFDIKNILTKEQLGDWKKCQSQCGPGFGGHGFGAGCGPKGHGFGAGCGPAGKAGPGYAPKGHGFGAAKFGEEFCPKHKR